MGTRRGALQLCLRALDSRRWRGNPPGSLGVSRQGFGVKDFKRVKNRARVTVVDNLFFCF